MSNANVIFKMMVNKFGADNLGIQNVYTPVNKIEEATGIKFYDFITPDTKNIAVLFNWEFIYTMLEEASKNNYTNDMQFTYFYDSEADKSALNFNGFDKYRFAKVNYKIDFVNISEFTEQNKNINVIEKAMAGKHFDIVFSNPPYNKNLDLKILNILFEYSKNIIFIHPASWCFCKDFSAYKHLTTVYNNRNKLKNLYLFWGNELFDIGLFCPLCISHWTPETDNKFTVVTDNAYSNETYNSMLGEFSYHGSFIEANNLKYKIYNYIDSHNGSILMHNIKAGYLNMTDFSVKFSAIRGGLTEKKMLCDAFYTIINKNKNDNKCDKLFRYSNVFDIHYKNIMTLWSFNTENEQNNFINYCCTKIVRFLLTFTKTNANVIPGQVTNIIPWLDFTQEWNDAKLCKEFGISEELWNYIDKFIPDYYEDYDDGFTSKVEFTAKAKTIISRHHGIEPNDEMKKFCPAEVIDYLMRTPITNKSGFVIRGFSKEGNYYYSFKEHNNDGDDTTFAWRVYRKAKRK